MTWPAVLALLVLGLWLRAARLGSDPEPFFSNMDEYHYIWVGLGLLHDGRPTSWSYLPNNPHELIRAGLVRLYDTDVTLTCPAFDHPPLFSLLAGAVAELAGASPIELHTNLNTRVRLWEVDLGRVRVAALLLYACSHLLLWDLAARRIGRWGALLALLLYATASHIVLHGRLLLTENFTTPLFLLNLCLWERLRAGRLRESTFGAATVVLTAAALLSKVVAASQAAALLVLLAAGRRRAALYPVAGVAAGLAIYLSYALWQGWDAFLLTMGDQAGRFVGFTHLIRIFARQQVATVDDPNALMMLMWIALLAQALAGHRRGWPLAIAGLVYLAAYFFFSDAGAIFGWHLVPFYPFLCVALAALFMEVWRRLTPVGYVGFVVVLLPAALQGLVATAPETLGLVRYAYMFLTAGALLLPWWPGRWVPVVQRVLLATCLAGVLAAEAGRAFAIP